MYILYRRFTSYKAANASRMYEMAREVNTMRNYSIVQPAASAPAQSTNAREPADNSRTQSSLRDVTLVDNDLYE